MRAAAGTRDHVAVVWDEQVRTGLEVALNEAEVVGLRIASSDSACELLVHVGAQPEPGAKDADPRRVLRLLGATRIRVLLREDRQDGYGPRALRIAGRLADGWVPSLRGDVTPLVEGSARLDEAAVEAGRDPADIRRVLNVNGEITGGHGGLLQRPVGQWVDYLTDRAVGHGFDTFMFWAEQPVSWPGSPRRSSRGCGHRSPPSAAGPSDSGTA